MDRRIEIIVSRIESDPGSVRLSELARKVNLSPSRLRHLFKQETGKRPGQYLKIERLKKAEGLLRTTFLTIKEIINQVGLASQGHFLRDFKKAYGMSPTEYRKAVGLRNPRSRVKR